MITNINNNFKDTVLDYDGISVVDFWASWCGPCKMFGPIFESASNEFKNFNFCKLNVDQDNEEISKKYGVMSIPTIIVFKNGIELKRNIGFLDEDSLKSFLGDI